MLQPKAIEKIGSAAYPAFAMIAGMQLDLFTPLSAASMSATQLAEILQVDPGKLSQLLYALVAADLLTVEDGLFANTPEAEQFLVRGKSSCLVGRHAFYTARYQEVMQTSASVRSGNPQAKLDFSSMSTEELAVYLRSLHPATLAAGRDLVSRADFSTCRHLLDVGGGSGGLALAIAAACPQLRAKVLELPSVASVTQRFIEQEGLSTRIEVIMEDVLHGPLTGSYDAAVLRAFLQVLSPADAQNVLHNLMAVLEPGSSIYILGQVLDDSRLSPQETVAFNLVFINVYDDGQAYTEGEYKGWLSRAGFVDIKRCVLVGGQSLITARKPS